MAVGNKNTQTLDNIKALSLLYSSEFFAFNGEVTKAKNDLEGVAKILNDKEAILIAERKQAEELAKAQQEALVAESLKKKEVEPKSEKSKKAEVKLEDKPEDKPQVIKPEEVKSKEVKPEEIKIQEIKTQEVKPLESKPQAIVQDPQKRQFINNKPDYVKRAPGQSNYQGGSPNYQNRQGQPGGYQNRQGQPGGYQNRPQGQPGQTGGYQNRQGQPGQAGGYQNRPQGQGGNYQNRPGFVPRNPNVNAFRPSPTASAVPIPAGKKVFVEKKKPFEKPYDDKRGTATNKKALVKKGLIGTFAPGDEDRMGSKKYKTKKTKEVIALERIKIEHATVNSEIIPLKTLSEKLGITASEITKRLFKNSIIKTINESIDYETAALIAIDLGIELELKLDKTAEDTLSAFHIAEDEGDVKMVKRPPVVTVLGHVDHGKTSLLDAFRKTSVVTGEAGGITQHIGAYTVKLNNQAITFIDTPGHEAFTAMRARGANITDVAILVVAADDGVMPQTIEAINHVKSAGVPIVVAINKIDKPNANPEKIKQQLSEHNVLTEEWGGDSIMVPVSAKSNLGLDKLLEAVLITADVKDLKANPNRKAKGTIIEAKLDKGQGPVATVLVQNGTLKIGDTIISGTSIGKIRAMFDDKGNSVRSAGPSYAVAVLGFSEVPIAGDTIFAADDEKLSRQVLSERVSLIKESKVRSSSKLSLDDAFSKVKDENFKVLNLIIKADVQGSVEALTESLMKIHNEEVKVSVIQGGVGALNESDIMLAKAANATIICFNVKADAKIKKYADQSKIPVKQYKIIYEAIDDLNLIVKGMLTPKYKEVPLGTAEVRNVFKITGSGMVAGCYVTKGKVARNANVRIKREGKQIFEGKISSVKRFKDDVKEVAADYECGISIENFSDIKELDIIEAYILELIPR